jgi:hypothetical protein
MTRWRWEPLDKYSYLVTPQGDPEADEMEVHFVGPVTAPACIRTACCIRLNSVCTRASILTGTLPNQVAYHVSLRLIDAQTLRCTRVDRATRGAVAEIGYADTPGNVLDLARTLTMLELRMPVI